MTEAEKEELAVRKRREEGTPVTLDSFTSWWDGFCAEMDEKKTEETGDLTNEEREKRRVREERMTGFQIFSEKSGVFHLDKLEAAAEEVENNNDGDDDGIDVDEELFDDDEDLDDLDFDSDDDDDEEDSDEEPDI